MPTTGHSTLDSVVLTAVVLTTLAGAVTALRVLWRSLFRPVLHFADVTRDATPVLLEVAREWRANGGTSVIDSIDTLKTSVTELAGTVAELHDYAHKTKHEQANILQSLLLQFSQLQRLTDEMRRSPDLRTRSTDPEGTSP